jgi:uncharacterized protein (DUF488 family)
MLKMKVYTIGYGGRKISDFISILEKHDITVVVDVRRFPKSKDPAFNRENLEKTLKENKIGYVFLGESLGGFVRGGYEKHMETQKFIEGFNMLLKIVERETAVLMCKERNVKYCHRRFIAQRLENLGVRVIHIV